MRVGVLGLQGGFAAHERALRDLGVAPVEVRRVAALDGLDALVMPGGESTTLLNLMRDEPWFESLTAFHERGGAILGTCAGAILLAREVRGPSQPSLGLLDVAVERNAWGRQVDSFEADVEIEGEQTSLHAVFIRAPRFRELGPGAVALARWGREVVAVRQGRILAASFHPELTPDRRLHRLLLDAATNRKAPAGVVLPHVHDTPAAARRNRC